MEELQEYFVEALRHCIESGMELPFILCAVSPSGSLVVTRINDGSQPNILAQHIEDDSFRMPINVMVVDRGGDAARVIINAGEISYQ